MLIYGQEEHEFYSLQANILDFGFLYTIPEGVVFGTAAMSAGGGLFVVVFNLWKPLTSIAESSV